MTPSVYIITSNGAAPIKIGVSQDPRGRLISLMTGMPYELKLAREWICTNAFAVENVAHKLLADCRMSGEWFNCTLDQAIAAVERAIEKNPSSKTAKQRVPDELVDWLMANNEWHRIELERIDALRATGRKMDRAEQKAWLAAGGMADIPRPIFPGTTSQKADPNWKPGA